MTVRLTLYATAGRATRNTVLGDGPLEPGGISGAALPPYEAVVRGPSTRCAQAAAALGLEAEAVPEPALRDLDHGTWRGRTIGDIAAADAYGLSAWLKDPDAAPPGGESVRQLCRRTLPWLRGLPSAPRSGAAGAHTLVIAEPAVVRALLVNAMSVPATTFWHLDVPALSAVSLTSHDDGWVWDVESRGAPVVRSRRHVDASGSRVGI
ncbi:histidine phosphatase family protein [Streptomyces sp. NPDC019396]|uniref:histidine phosphatase family protein n=1 Tax=Streptomyces sp. NPDC019396 TaxID=3154687 RepID=UPI0033E38080